MRHINKEIDNLWKERRKFHNKSISKQIKIYHKANNCLNLMSQLKNELEELRYGSCKELKLKYLIELNNIKINNLVDRKTLLMKRNCFNFIKRNIKIDNCFVCDEKAIHRHHIIPLKNGGNNKQKNIVGLCGACHKIIHPWLVIKE
jgi:hypothetical protein